MRLLRLSWTLAVIAVIGVSCTRSPEPAAGERADSTAGGQPDTAARVQLLVETLPADVEGLELTDKGLRVRKGYEYTQESDSTFAIMRQSDGQVITVGGCGCRSGPGCVPVMTDDGNIICVTILCTPCGLAVTGPSGRLAVARYERP